ncbi:hypothetical protein D5086_008236 [Populus alba]|uniref:Uncharacterized protein n=1 Tax=Populus alba TaxID=43335 RepID=A0ACC4CF81_POPAL
MLHAQFDRCEAKENAREEEFKAPPCSKICCLLSNQVFDHFYPQKAEGHGLIPQETLAEQLRFKASNVKIQGHLDKLGREKTVKPKLERKRAPNKRSLDELWFHLLQNNNGFGMHNQSCSNKEWLCLRLLPSLPPHFHIFFMNSNGITYWSSTSLPQPCIFVMLMDVASLIGPLHQPMGKLAIFVIGAWAGASYGGVLAGLAACGVMMNIVSTASDLSQDFKTGYLTLSSPRSMFAFKDLGTTGSQYPAPYATVYRNMAILGVEGFSALPKNCLYLCYGFFGAAILINLIKDALGKKWARFIPNPMAMAIPFYIGSYFAIDMCLGSLILFIWEKIDKVKADAFGPAVASGLICGDGIWTLPSSILALAGVKPPICMKFFVKGNK